MMKLKAKRSLCISIFLALVMCVSIAFVACDNVNSSVDNAEYTITFETEGGSVVDPITVKSGELAEKPENPTKAGHVFKGWYRDLNDTTGGSFIFDETPIRENLTLYALWQIRQYTISYQDEFGNAIAGLENGIVNWGTLLEKPDETGLAKEGYLVKWYTAAGDIWNFETDKVVANTSLTCRYVTTKDSYNAADIAQNCYSSYDRGNLDPAVSTEHYTEGAETIYYSYGGTALQQVILNVELSTLEYSSVSIVARSVGFTVAEDVYTFDATSGGSFSQLRAYILTDMGGHVSYNDKGASGYDPVNYYIQSTGTNKNLFSANTDSEGWTTFNFDLASLKYWNDGETLYAFGFGFVSTSKAIEIKSIVFNKVDKTQTFSVDFTDRIGNELAESQTVAWNAAATKPAKLEDSNGCVYTGEWLDASGEVYDFSKGVRGNITLYPQYTVENKYSWTGEEVGRDFFAAYNEDKTLPANEYAHNGNTVFTFNNGSGSALRQIASDNLNLTIGNYKYLTVKWRTVDYNGYAYNATGAFALVRIYILTDLGGNVLDKDVEGAENFYLNFNTLSASQVTTPVDMTAKMEGGWYVVTVDLTAIPYYNDGTTLKGFAIGTTTGSINAIEVTEISLSETLTNADTTYSVSFVDEEGNAITAIENQNVPYGKAAAMPDSSLVPVKTDYAFDRWVDAEGNDFNFAQAVTENVVLHPVYIESWEGKNYTLAGQQIVDSFTASYERYGNTVNNQNALSLNENNEAYFDFAPLNKPNMTITMLNAGIRVHEGSKLVVTYTSNKYPDYTPNRINLCIAFRGQNAASQIANTNTNTYYQWKDIAFGTLSGSNDDMGIAFVIAEDGTVTVTMDLYLMQQAYAAKGIAEDGVNLGYIDAFTFMIVETNSGTGAKTSKATLTYKNIEFKDVQMSKGTEGDLDEGVTSGDWKGETIVLKGQQILDAYTASYERYGNTVDKQAALSLDDKGNAYHEYNYGKANKSITALNAGIRVHKGSKIVLKYKSSATAEGYYAVQLKIGYAYRGEDPATTIHNKAKVAHYYNVKPDAGVKSATNTEGTISYAVDDNGEVTVTFDLWALYEYEVNKGIVTADANGPIFDAFSILIVESNDGTAAASNNCTITYNSIEYQDVQIVAKEEANA